MKLKSIRMAYLVDGHNLIPKLAGFSLQALDDETQLIELLQEFCRLRRKQVEVFFDNSPPGQPRVRSYGAVLARFVREGQTADDAIRARLRRLGKAARNWTVVSSDRMVQAAAHEARSQVLSSEEFAVQIAKALEETSSDPKKSADPSLSPDEIDDWLDLFNKGRDPGRTE